MSDQQNNANDNHPDAAAITDVPSRDISALMNPGTHKHQRMQGFDDDYVDIVDYYDNKRSRPMQTPLSSR